MRILVYDQPFVVASPKEFIVDSLGEWLLGYYSGFSDMRLQIFEGQPSSESEITQDAAKIAKGCFPLCTILESPGDPATISIAAILTQIAVSVAITLVLKLLAPTPSVPSNVNRNQQSPNNALGQRENQVRFMERVEDIYGTVKSVPSLMMPTYLKYKNNKKFEYGYYCVGRGYYDLSNIQDGDTLLASILGSSAAVYEPFTSPNNSTPSYSIGATITDDIVTAKRSVEVDGIVLKAINQVQLPASVVYTYTPDPAGDIITQANKQPNFSSCTNVGDTITVSGAGAPYDGTYTVYFVNDGNISLTTSTWGAPFTGASTVLISSSYTYIDPITGLPVLVTLPTEYTAWTTLPSTTRDRVWANITAASGMYKDNGSKSVASTNFELIIEELDFNSFAPTGFVEVVTGNLSGSVTEERALTMEHTTSWIGPARVRMRRTNPFDFGFSGTVVDEVKWVDLYSVSPATKSDFGNKTTIHTITEATPRATAVKTRQLNCLATRKLPTFDGIGFSGILDNTGLLLSGTVNPTSKIVDIIASISSDPFIGRLDLDSEVDMAQLWAVQQELDSWSSNTGIFNYTFDSDNISFEEMVITVANAAFCIAYRQNGKIRVAFDKLQENSTALFTHRNKKPNAESVTRRFSNDAEYDAIHFIYNDPESNQSETITLPLDGSGTKFKKYEIAGIRNFSQAWYRANREYQKLIGQRITIETETTTDARSLLPNSRIDIVDNTRFKSFDGEVVGQIGLELTLSQSIEFTPYTNHSIVLMRRDGGLQSINVTPGSNSNKVVLQSLPLEAIKTTQDQDGVRTIFSFASDSARDSMAYLIQDIDIVDEQYVKINAINYSSDYYQFDVMPVPDKLPIISGAIQQSSGNSYLLTEDGDIFITETGDAFIQE